MCIKEKHNSSCFIIFYTLKQIFLFVQLQWSRFSIAKYFSFILILLIMRKVYLGFEAMKYVKECSFQVSYEKLVIAFYSKTF